MTLYFESCEGFHSFFRAIRGSEWFFHVLKKMLVYAAKWSFHQNSPPGCCFKHSMCMDPDFMGSQKWWPRLTCAPLLTSQNGSWWRWTIIWPHVFSASVFIMTHSHAHPVAQNYPDVLNICFGPGTIRWKFCWARNVKIIIFRRYAHSPGLKKKKKSVVQTWFLNCWIMRYSFNSGLKMSAFGFDVLKLLFIIW